MTKETIIKMPDFVEDFEKNILIDEDAEIKRLLGDEHTVGSNIWKIEELINGLATGIYSADDVLKNELETLPLPGIGSETTSHEGNSHVMRQNRKMLESLYQKYEVDQSKAEVTESYDGEYTTRRTFYATELGFDFVEVEIFQNEERGRFDALIVHDNS